MASIEMRPVFYIRLCRENTIKISLAFLTLNIISIFSKFLKGYKWYNSLVEVHGLLILVVKFDLHMLCV